MTISIGLIGAGRIGRTHAAALKDVPEARLAAVSDLVAEAAEAIAAPAGARVASAEEIFADPRIDAVAICSPTSLHADQIEAAAHAGKAIFCEKPIDLDLARAQACVAVVEETGAQLMLGFNRRFDAQFEEAQRRIAAGEIGDVELVQITSRDPAPAPAEYIRASGGLFKDMTIHDFDMARFLMGEEFTAVFASAASLTTDYIREAGDVDTAIVTLRTASGQQAVITNSRRATYGYDQRAEAHGSKGMISVNNPTPSVISLAGSAGYSKGPLFDFFMDRYADAYRLEMTTFAKAVAKGETLTPSGADGLRALELAEAAGQSLETGGWVNVR